MYPHMHPHMHAYMHAQINACIVHMCMCACTFVCGCRCPCVSAPPPTGGCANPEPGCIYRVLTWNRTKCLPNRISQIEPDSSTCFRANLTPARGCPSGKHGFYARTGVLTMSGSISRVVICGEKYETFVKFMHSFIHSFIQPLRFGGRKVPKV